jgi:tripartite-type tricarboxylate transporter receptor subunit TctC
MVQLTRRHALFAAIGGAAFSALPFVSAQSFPSRPITLLVGVPPGGSLETQARALGLSVSKQLGQPVIIVNRTGVGGTLAAASLSQSGVVPDGYTLAVVPAAVFRMPHLQKVPYDPLRDFTYIANVVDQPFALLVRADARWKNLQEFLSHARANPGLVSYGTTGAGTTQHIAMTALASQAGVKLNQIPFRGAADSYNALLGGHIDALAGTGFATAFHDGKVRLLAMLNDRRSRRWPEVPTLRDLGFNVTAKGGWGICGPKNMDPQVVKVLYDALQVAMSDPVFLRTVEQEGQWLTPMNPATYSAWAAKEFEEAKRQITELGFRLE